MLIGKHFAIIREEPGEIAIGWKSLHILDYQDYPRVWSYMGNQSWGGSCYAHRLPESVFLPGPGLKRHVAVWANERFNARLTGIPIEWSSVIKKIADKEVQTPDNMSLDQSGLSVLVGPWH